MRVRTRAGEFVPVGAAYLPGGIVSDRDQADTRFCVDTGFHKLELELLTEIGCVAQPTLRHDPPEEPWLLNYSEQLKQIFITSASGSKPQPDRLLLAGAADPWPLQPLGQLSGGAGLTI